MEDQQIINVDEKEVKLIVFRQGRHLFALYSNDACEIFPYSPQAWFPGATERIPGVVNVRGDIAAVIDLGHVLNIINKQSKERQGYYIALKGSDGRSMIWVDDIVDVIDLQVSAIMPLLPSLDEQIRQVADQQFSYQDMVVTILNGNLLLEKVMC